MVDQFGRWYPDFPGQQPYQDPMYMRAMGQQGQHQGQGMQAQQTQQNVRTVEAVQVDGEKIMHEFPVANGCTVLMFTKDDSVIGVKSVSVSGQATVDYYDHRPPAPTPEPMNPADYVRRDEVADLVADILQAQSAAKRQTPKKEDA